MRIAGELGLKISPFLPNFWQTARRKLDGQKKPNADMPVTPDVGQFWRKAKAKIDAANKSAAEMPVTADTTRATSEMMAWRAAQESKSTSIPVQIDTRRAEERIRYLEHTWKQSDLKRAIRVQVYVAGASLLPPLAQGITSVTAAITNLSRATLILPGALSGAVAAAATLATGFNGIADALKASNDGMQKSEQFTRQYARAARDLESAQRDVVRALKDANREIQDQKDTLAQGQLGVERARLNVMRANERLAEGGFRSMTDYQDAVLGAKEANLQLSIAVKEAAREVEDYYENASRSVTENEAFRNSLDGLSNAVENFRKAQFQAAGMSEQFISAMRNLSPTAQDFVLQLLKVKNAFREVQKGAQDVLVGGLGKEIETLAQRQLPVLSKGMKQVAAGLNADFKQIIRTIGNANNTDAIAKIFERTGQALNALTPGLRALTNSFLQLSEVGTRFLPRLAFAFNRVTERFAAFIDKADKDGSLARWIDSGLKLLSSLGRSLLDIGSILGGITTAYERATGNVGGFASTMERQLSKLANYLNSPAGQTQLTKWVRTGQDFMDMLRETLPGIRKLLGLIGDGLRQFAAYFFPAFSNIGKTLADHADILKRVLAIYLGFRTIKPIFSGLIKASRSMNASMLTFADKQKAAFERLAVAQKEYAAAQADLAKVRQTAAAGKENLAQARASWNQARDMRGEAKKELAQARKDVKKAQADLNAVTATPGRIRPRTEQQTALAAAETRLANAKKAVAAANAEVKKTDKSLSAQMASSSSNRAAITATLSEHEKKVAATRKQYDLASRAVDKSSTSWGRLKMALGSGRGGGLAGMLGGIAGAFGRLTTVIGSVGTAATTLYALDQYMAATDRARASIDNLRESHEQLNNTLAKATGSATAQTVEEINTQLRSRPNPVHPDDPGQRFDAISILEQQMGMKPRETVNLALPTEYQRREARLAPADARIIAAVPGLSEWKVWGKYYEQNGVTTTVYGKALNGDPASIGMVEAARRAIKDADPLGRAMNLGMAQRALLAPNDLGGAQEQLSRSGPGGGDRGLSLAAGAVRGVGNEAISAGRSQQQSAQAVEQPGLSERGKRVFGPFRIGPGGAVLLPDGSAVIELDVNPDTIVPGWSDGARANGIEVSPRFPGGAVINIDPENAKRYFNALASGYSIGGPVRGPGTATSDSIPAMLSDGEFVINARSASAIGHDVLNRMNMMGVRGFKGGGSIKAAGGAYIPIGPGEEPDTWLWRSTVPIFGGPAGLWSGADPVILPPDGERPPGYSTGGSVTLPGPAREKIRLGPAMGPTIEDFLNPDYSGATNPAPPGGPLAAIAAASATGIENLPAPFTPQAMSPPRQGTLNVGESIGSGVDSSRPGPIIDGYLVLPALWPGFRRSEPFTTRKLNASDFGGVDSSPVETPMTHGFGSQPGERGPASFPGVPRGPYYPNEGPVVPAAPGSPPSPGPSAATPSMSGPYGRIVGSGVPYGLPRGTNTGGYGQPTDAFPPWVYELGNRFGVKPSTYPGHQEGAGSNRGIDWVSSFPAGSPQAIAQMEEFAKALVRDNPAGLEQVIFENPLTGTRIGKDPGDRGPNQTIDDYYRDDWAGHQNHVHTRFSQGVTFDASLPPGSSPPLTPPLTPPPGVVGVPGAPPPLPPPLPSIAATPAPGVPGMAPNMPIGPLEILKQIGIAILEGVLGFFGINIDLDGILGGIGSIGGVTPDPMASIPQPDDGLLNQMDTLAQYYEQSGNKEMADSLRKQKENYLKQFERSNVSSAMESLAQYYDSVGMPEEAAKQREQLKRLLDGPAASLPAKPGAAPGRQRNFTGGPLKDSMAAYIVEAATFAGLNELETDMALAVAQHESAWNQVGFMGFGPEAKAAGFNFDSDPQGAVNQYIRQYVDRLPDDLNRYDPNSVANYIWRTVHAAADPDYVSKLINNYRSIVGYRMGGHVRGPGTKTSDSIPAMLSDGEFVMRSDAVRHWGVDRLEQMNSTKGYAEGGLIKLDGPATETITTGPRGVSTTGSTVAAPRMIGLEEGARQLGLDPFYRPPEMYGGGGSFGLSQAIAPPPPGSPVMRSGDPGDLLGGGGPFDLARYPALPSPTGPLLGGGGSFAGDYDYRSRIWSNINKNSKITTHLENAGIDLTGSGWIKPWMNLETLSSFDPVLSRLVGAVPSALTDLFAFTGKEMADMTEIPDLYKAQQWIDDPTASFSEKLLNGYLMQAAMLPLPPGGKQVALSVFEKARQIFKIPRDVKKENLMEGVDVQLGKFDFSDQVAAAPGALNPQAAADITDTMAVMNYLFPEIKDTYLHISKQLPVIPNPEIRNRAAREWVENNLPEAISAPPPKPAGLRITENHLGGDADIPAMQGPGMLAGSHSMPPAPQLYRGLDFVEGEFSPLGQGWEELIAESLFRISDRSYLDNYESPLARFAGQAMIWKRKYQNIFNRGISGPADFDAFEEAVELASLYEAKARDMRMDSGRIFTPPSIAVNPKYTRGPGAYQGNEAGTRGSTKLNFRTRGAYELGLGSYFADLVHETGHLLHNFSLTKPLSRHELLQQFMGAYLGVEPNSLRRRDIDKVLRNNRQAEKILSWVISEATSGYAWQDSSRLFASYVPDHLLDLADSQGFGGAVRLAMDDLNQKELLAESFADAIPLLAPNSGVRPSHAVSENLFRKLLSDYEVAVRGADRAMARRGDVRRAGGATRGDLMRFGPELPTAPSLSKWPTEGYSGGIPIPGAKGVKRNPDGSVTVGGIELPRNVSERESFNPRKPRAYEQIFPSLPGWYPVGDSIGGKWFSEESRRQLQAGEAGGRINRSGGLYEFGDSRGPFAMESSPPETAVQDFLSMYPGDTWRSGNQEWLDPVMKNAIRDWTGSPEVNYIVRTSREYDPLLLDGRNAKNIFTQMPILDVAMDRAPRIPRDVIVTRMLGLEAFGGQKINRRPETVDEDKLTELLDSIMGGIFTDSGYMPATVGRSYDRPTDMISSLGNILGMVFPVPEGSRGLFLSNPRSPLSGFGDSERELLLPRGGAYTPFDWAFADPSHPELGAWVFAEYTQPKDIAPFPQFKVPDLSVDANMGRLKEIAEATGLTPDELALLLNAQMPGKTVIDLGSLSDAAADALPAPPPVYMDKYDEIAKAMVDKDNYEAWKKGSDNYIDDANELVAAADAVDADELGGFTGSAAIPYEDDANELAAAALGGFTSSTPKPPPPPPKPLYKNWILKHFKTGSDALTDSPSKFVEGAFLSEAKLIDQAKNPGHQKYATKPNFLPEPDHLIPPQTTGKTNLSQWMKNDPWKINDPAKVEPHHPESPVAMSISEIGDDTAWAHFDWPGLKNNFLPGGADFGPISLQIPGGTINPSSALDAIQYMHALTSEQRDINRVYSDAITPGFVNRYPLLDYYMEHFPLMGEGIATPAVGDFGDYHKKWFLEGGKVTDIYDNKKLPASAPPVKYMPKAPSANVPFPFQTDRIYTNFRKFYTTDAKVGSSTFGNLNAEELLNLFSTLGTATPGASFSTNMLPISQTAMADVDILRPIAFGLRGRFYDDLISAIATARNMPEYYDVPLLGQPIGDWEAALWKFMDDPLPSSASGIENIAGLSPEWWKQKLDIATETAQIFVDGSNKVTYAERYLRTLLDDPDYLPGKNPGTKQHSLGGDHHTVVGHGPDTFALNLAERDLIDLIFSPPYRASKAAAASAGEAPRSAAYDFTLRGPAFANLGRYLAMHETSMLGDTPVKPGISLMPQYQKWLNFGASPGMSLLNARELETLAYHFPRLRQMIDAYIHRSNQAGWISHGFKKHNIHLPPEGMLDIFDAVAMLADARNPDPNIWGIGQPEVFGSKILDALGLTRTPDTFSHGGAVSGRGTSTSDSILARLSDGEFVMSAQAVNHWGLDRLTAMNDLPGFNTGGPVGDIPLVPPPPPPKTITPNVDPFVPALANEIPRENDLNTLEPSRLSLSALGSTPEEIGQAGAGIVGAILAPKGGGGGGSPGAPQPQPTDPRAAIAPAPTSSQHIHPAMAAIISAPIGMLGSAIGQAASTAASTGTMLALAGSTMGGGAALAPIVAPMVGAAAGQLAQFGTQIANDVTVGAANILSSLLVGTVTPSQTGQGYGAPLLPPPPPPVNNFQSIHNGNVVTNNLSEYNRLKDRKDAQKAAPFFNRVGS